MNAEAPHGTLDGIRAAVWALLEEGVANRASPARLPVLATVGQAGAEARLVVLRGADRATETLTIHSDSASSKVEELARAPNATLLIWDAASSVQVRLRVAISIAQGTAEDWAAIPPAARGVYGGTPRPGDAIDRPEAFAPQPDPARLAVLRAAIREFEFLHLGEIHRRAVFQGKTARWVAP